MPTTNPVFREVLLANVRSYSRKLANVRTLFYFRRHSPSFALFRNFRRTMAKVKKGPADFEGISSKISLNREMNTFTLRVGRPVPIRTGCKSKTIFFKKQKMIKFYILLF